MQTPINATSLGLDQGLPLECSGDDPASLRRDIQHLFDIEAIKQLKHAYFRCIDTANLEELATLFHDEVQVHFIGGTYEWKTSSKAEYVENIGNAFNKHAIGHHNGHQPEIRLLSETEAVGVWYLSDVMYILNHNFRTSGTAIYSDRYVKENGRWLIRETRYARLYEQNELMDKTPEFSAHYLKHHGRDG